MEIFGQQKNVYHFIFGNTGWNEFKFIIAKFLE